MKKAFGIILLFIDSIFIIGGLTCLIVGSILYKIGQDYQIPLINTLFALGFCGAGSFLATIFALLGSGILLSD